MRIVKFNKLTKKLCVELHGTFCTINTNCSIDNYRMSKGDVIMLQKREIMSDDIMSWRLSSDPLHKRAARSVNIVSNPQNRLRFSYKNEVLLYVKSPS